MINDIVVFCDSSILQSDTICNIMTITPINYTDTDLSNNISISCKEVRSLSNTMTVFPTGIGKNGLIDRYTQLNYFINFQNTGSDTIHNLVIRDTLDANIDPNTVYFLYVYPLPPATYANGVITFEFDSINLPPSSTNNAASRGYGYFYGFPKMSLPSGTQIFNKAYLYMDSGKVIQTNTTVNTIKGPPTEVSEINTTKNEFQIYPNPASSLLNIKRNGNGLNAQLMIYDITGKCVLREKVNFNINVVQVPIILQNGSYIGQITDDFGERDNLLFSVIK